MQVITEEAAWNFNFPLDAVKVFGKKDTIQIGNNYFSPRGIRVSLNKEEDGRTIKIEGRIRYAGLAALKSDIMGPFRYVPFLQCRHGVVSMCHKTRGSLKAVSYTHLQGIQVFFHNQAVRGGLDKLRGKHKIIHDTAAVCGRRGAVQYIRINENTIPLPQDMGLRSSH